MAKLSEAKPWITDEELKEEVQKCLSQGDGWMVVQEFGEVTEVHAGGERAVILAQPGDHVLLGLGHDADAEDDGDRDEDDHDAQHHVAAGEEREGVEWFHGDGSGQSGRGSCMRRGGAAGKRRGCVPTQSRRCPSPPSRYICIGPLH